MRTIGDIDQVQIEERAERIARLNGSLIVAIRSGDRDVIHNACRNLRLEVGALERHIKELP